MKKLMAQTIQASDLVEQRARIYCDNGIKVLDALQLACSVEAQANYFYIKQCDVDSIKVTFMSTGSRQTLPK